MIVTFEDYLVRDFPTKENGIKAVGVPIWVYVHGTNELAELYKENNTRTSNPIITDERGNYSFKVEEGFYDFKVNVNTDAEAFLYEDKVVFGESVFIDAFEAYEVPPFNGNQFELPRKAEHIFVTINGRGIAPSGVTIGDDGVTVTLIDYVVNTGDSVVARAAFVDPNTGSGSGGNLIRVASTSDISGLDGVQVGSVVLTDSFHSELSYGGAAYDILTTAEKDAKGYAVSAENYTHFQITDTDYWACLRFNKAIVLDKVGGKKDDTAFDNKPVHEAALTLTDTIYLTGNYFATNIIFPIKELTYRGIGNGYCKFKALDLGIYDSGYFAAPKTWLENSSSCNPPITTESVGFDGGNRDYALVVHWYFGNHENLFVDNGSTNAVLMTALNRDGSAISSTMVNNRFRNVWIEGGANIGFQVTEDGKTTDWELVGGYIFNDGSIGGTSSSVNISAATCAGATISGIHGYGADRNLSISKWSTGTRVFGNYFENDVQIRQGLNDTFPLTFGPANTVNGDLQLLLGVVCGPIKSIDNFYRGVITHNYFGDKKIYSTGDNFTDAAPFRFSNTNPANESSFSVLNALIGNESVSGLLSPTTTTLNSSLKNDFSDGGSASLDTDNLVSLNFGSSSIPAGGEVRSLIPFKGSDLTSQTDVFIAAIKGLPVGVSQSVYFDQAGDNKWKIKLVNSTNSTATLTSTTAIVTKFN